MRLNDCLLKDEEHYGTTYIDQWYKVHLITCAVVYDKNLLDLKATKVYLAEKQSCSNFKLELSPVCLKSSFDIKMDVSGKIILSAHLESASLVQISSNPTPQINTI